MGQYFRNEMHDEFGTWPLGYLANGGPGVGVIAAVGAAVGDGDDTAFHEAWMAAGNRFAAEAEACGTPASAGRAWLWAAACFATSYHPLFGAPVDPRLVAAFRAQIAAFDRGLALRPHPVPPMRIPWQDTTMPAYLLPAVGRETERRPLVILTNGYDATVTEMYFAIGAAVAERGFHCLMFDGPGQGEMLIEQGIPMRPDWEAVVPAVVDFALTLPGVDPDRIALSGWSLGGYLALRAATGEPRLAAVVADPGLRAVLSPGALPPPVLELTRHAEAGTLTESVLEAALKLSPRLRWTLMKRGMWVHGSTSLGAYFHAATAMTLEGRIGAIGCPVLLTQAENDHLGGGAGALAAEITAPVTLLRFTAAEGAGEHCEMRNRPLANQRILDWLAEIFGEA